ncbi:MAG: xanthine dehydrogenase family protein subunit M [Gemmatimonadota bacterium]|nr:MAG: xanthine dehydrogenase family protein subunit M [Gemmatimonadota bacterium]
MRVLFPNTLDEAYGMLAAEPLTPVAGGTDLLAHWPGNHDARKRAYMDLSGVSGLRFIHWGDEALTLGGLTTYSDVIRDSRVAEEFPLLADAGTQVGSIQIQTRGTWAGNIANGSPAADGVPVLMGYDAVVVLGSEEGDQEIPLSDFYLGYKEMRLQAHQLIRAIRLPRHEYGFQRFVKVGGRNSQAITKIGVALTCAGGRWRVVVNSMAPTVRRCPALEALLDAARPVSGPEDLLTAIREDLAPIDDIRSTATYREKALARVLYFDLKGVCTSFA